jgi:hypothetical protein
MATKSPALLLTMIIVPEVSSTEAQAPTKGPSRQQPMPWTLISKFLPAKIFEKL